jgi:hypothetical protein
VARDESDWDWAGALIAAEFVDDVRYLRRFAEACAKAMSKKR